MQESHHGTILKNLNANSHQVSLVEENKALNELFQFTDHIYHTTTSS
jgi:hypothetical protein